jgi:pyrroloquinoline quinone (PQQ) biosynthesis protein C
MDTTIGFEKPRFRPAVSAAVGAGGVEIALGEGRCAFDFEPGEASGVSRLIVHLASGGRTVDELAAQSPEIAEKIPALLQDFDRLRLLVETDPPPVEGLVSGAQLYREVRRLADRVTRRLAKSAFHRELVEERASRAQLIGYALEYYWIVKAAPGLIGPALATAQSPAERTLIQGFLRSELGHDRFLAQALAAVGVSAAELEVHQPLTTTFALCASLGVYARQHPLSFKAALFLFERAQPAFVDAFDERCRQLGLPEAFYAPLRAHADLNSEYDHEDISRSLMALEAVVDFEAATVVKRHIALLIETMIQQEEQILDVYGRRRDRIARMPRVLAEV